MRRAARVDANQAEIVQALRQVGASVQPIHMVGQGVPDLLIGYLGCNWLFEIKDGSKPQSRQSLTPDEKAWHESWRGSVYIVNDPEQAITLLRQLVKDEYPF